MKKFLFLSLASAIIAFSFYGCSKNDSLIVEPKGEDVEYFTVSFSAVSDNPKTKSVFGELADNAYTTIWTENTKVKIDVNYSNAVEAPVVPSSDGKTATFNATITAPADRAGYTFRAISPSTCYSGTSAKIKIPAEQTPIEGSVDEAAHIMAAQSETYTTFPQNVTLPFSHVVAYGKFTLKNFPDDVIINNIEIVAEPGVNLAGVFSLDYSTKVLTAQSDLSNVIVVNTSALTSRTFWIALNTVNLEGKTLTFNINTDAGKYVKTYTYGTGKGNFRTGHVRTLTLNMAGIAPIVPKYKLVTDYSELTEGSTVIIASASYNYAFSNKITYVYDFANDAGTPVSITKSGDVITNPGDDVQIFTLKKGTKYDNAVQFELANGNFAGYYLGGPNGTSYSTSSIGILSTSFENYANAYTDFHINLSWGKIYLDEAMPHSNKCLGFTSSENRFYTTSGYSPDQYLEIYKLEGSGEGGTQLILPQPEISFTSGIVIKDEAYYLGALSVPASGGTYEINYTVKYPQPNVRLQFNGGISWIPNNNMTIEDGYAVENGKITVVIPANTSSSSRRDHFVFGLDYPIGGGAYVDVHGVWIWVEQAGTSIK